jgi:T4 RnlA family RNA ligase
MRGISYVFNSDGSLFKRYLLLEKFFNLNQVPDTMYSEVKDFKIKSIYNKEDGSVASFIKLPDGSVFGKSKMSVITDQAEGIMRVYKSNASVKRFVDWTFDNDITAIFEYVAPSNKIVLRYAKEDLILLKLRDNVTGELLDLNDYLDVIGDIRVAPSEAGYTLDELIEMASYTEDKEGWIIEFTNGVLMKIKTDWYFKRHGILTEDIYRENVIINYILTDEIDDVIAQIPEDEVEAHARIEKIISIVKRALSKKVDEIRKSYEFYLTVGSRKDYAINYRGKEENFAWVMKMANVDEMALLSREEILEIYETYERYENMIKTSEPFEMAKVWLSRDTNKLLIAREWLSKIDPTLFFIDVEEDVED